MTAPQGPNRQRVSEDYAFATLLWEGQGYERCYDAFAPALYRYCWTLLGPSTEREDDAPGAAVHETFLAAVALLPQLRDRDLFRAWLFALARAVCQQRGFATDAPYALLSVHAENQPFRDVLLELPPSHRELLELSLRHGLSHTQIAVVLGLDPETVSELCRSAAKRATDLLTENSGTDDRPGSRWGLADIPLALTSIALPGPPRRLRERVIADCASPGAAPRREAAGVAVRPLGPNGFPLQRIRGAASTPQDSGVPEVAADPTEDAPPTSSPTVPDTAAVPAAGPLSGPATGEVDGEHGADEPHRLSGWLLPAAAGLFTALVAFSLWGIGVFLNGSGAPVVGAPPPVGGVTATPLSGHVTETSEPDPGGVPVEPSAPPLPEPTGEATPPEESGSGADPGPAEPTDSSTGEAEAPNPAPQAPEDDPAADAPPEPAPQPQSAPEDSPAPPSESPQNQESGVVTTLLDEVLGLLGLKGGG